MDFLWKTTDRSSSQNQLSAVLKTRCTTEEQAARFGLSTVQQIAEAYGWTLDVNEADIS